MIPLPYVVPEQSRPSLPTPEAFEALKAQYADLLANYAALCVMGQNVSEELGEHEDIQDGPDGTPSPDWVMRLKGEVDREMERQGVVLR